MSYPRQELENLWRTRLRDAALRLEFARNFLKEVQQDFPSCDLPSADGRFAFQQALRAENNALAEYNRLLRIFTDLIVDGTIPDENDWLKQKPKIADGEGQ